MQTTDPVRVVRNIPRKICPLSAHLLVARKGFTWRVADFGLLMLKVAAMERCTLPPLKSNEWLRIQMFCKSFILSVHGLVCPDDGVACEMDAGAARILKPFLTPLTASAITIASTIAPMTR